LGQIRGRGTRGKELKGPGPAARPGEQIAKKGYYRGKGREK